MKDDPTNPQIDSARIPVGGNAAGLFIVIGSMAIFLIGLPVVRYMFPAAVVVGGGIALALHFIRRETPGKSWILAATKK